MWNNSKFHNYFLPNINTYFYNNKIKCIYTFI